MAVNLFNFDILQTTENLDMYTADLLISTLARFTSINIIQSVPPIAETPKNPYQDVLNTKKPGSSLYHQVKGFFNLGQPEIEATWKELF